MQLRLSDTTVSQVVRPNINLRSSTQLRSHKTEDYFTVTVRLVFTVLCIYVTVIFVVPENRSTHLHKHQPSSNNSNIKSHAEEFFRETYGRPFSQETSSLL